MKRNFVSISGDTYSFYEGNRHVATIKSPDMNAEWLEIYRTDHAKLLADIPSDEPILA